MPVPDWKEMKPQCGNIYLVTKSMSGEEVKSTVLKLHYSKPHFQNEGNAKNQTSHMDDEKYIIIVIVAIVITVVVIKFP